VYLASVTNSTIRNKVFNLKFPSLFRDIYVSENAGVSLVGFETGESVVDRFSCSAEVFLWDTARWRDGVNELG
jgi:hypothetical protein